MSKSIRTLLATTAGITACVLAYYLTASLLFMFLHWLAGNDAIFQQIYRGFDENPVFMLLRLAVGLYLGFVAYRMGWKYFGKFGIPGLLAPYSEAADEQPIAVRVYVNGQDETGQLARLEVFSHKVAAAKLQEFYWGDGTKPLIIRGQAGLYLVLVKTPKSPYHAENSSDEPSIAVKVRTRTHLLHSLESVWGQTPTYVVQEGKPVAFFRLALDYVGSQTDSYGMLSCHGERGLMETVFLKEPKAARTQASTATAPALPEQASEPHQSSDPTQPSTQPAS